MTPSGAPADPVSGDLDLIVSSGCEMGPGTDIFVKITARIGRCGGGQVMTGELFVRRGGSQGPTLLLVHGLAANAEVWDGVIALAQRCWPGRWIAPDLRGHGRSGASGSLPQASAGLRLGSSGPAAYSYSGYAADLADLIEADSPVTVLGHSMGGVVGLTLASGLFGVTVERVIGVGIKVDWTEQEASRMALLATRPPALFDRRDEAIARGLRLAGLQGLVAETSAAATAGVIEDLVVADELVGDRAVGNRRGYRVAFDPAVNGIGPPPMQRLLAAADSGVTLACGEFDPMVTVDQLRALHPDCVELAGLGHNAHVEAPELLWETLLARPSDRR